MMEPAMLKKVDRAKIVIGTKILVKEIFCAVLKMKLAVILIKIKDAILIVYFQTPIVKNQRYVFFHQQG